MPKFIAVHTMPGYTEQNMAAAAKQMVEKVPKGFTWNLSYCAFDQNKYFCEWDAPSKEALEEGFRQNNVPFDAVYPVKQFNVAKGGFEAEKQPVSSSTQG